MKSRLQPFLVPVKKAAVKLILALAELNYIKKLVRDCTSNTRQTLDYNMWYMNLFEE